MAVSCRLFPRLLVAEPMLTTTALREAALARLRQTVMQIGPAEALRRQGDGAVLIDVRPLEQSSSGTAPGAHRLNRDKLELQIEEIAGEPSQSILLMCTSGVTSLFAAENLQRMGYCDVCSIDGGFTRWQAEGLPVAAVDALSAEQSQRYARHLSLPEVGEAGQLRLQRAAVALIGAGGLGSPAALYLAAAGVGKLTIIDNDIVERSNLQRQVLHRDASTGSPKVDSARVTLEALNPDTRISALNTHIISDNANELLSGHDVVIDGSDNFQTRYLVNDACVALGIANVHASVFRFEGQLSVFWPAGGGGPCYRCLYAAPPPAEFSPSCAEAGVIGALPGIFGALQASEALKIILGIGQPLVGRLLHFDALAGRFAEFAIETDTSCSVCKSNSSVVPG